MPYKDPEEARRRKRQWRLDNLERIRAQRKAHYAKDAERQREKARQWHAENREQAKATAQAWRAKNLAAARERARLRHLGNLDRDRARSKAWHKANRSICCARAKARYHAADKDAERARSRAWRATHQDRARELSRRSKQKRRSSERGAFIEYVDRVVVFVRDKGQCGICQRAVNPKSRWHVDHVIPLDKGGTDCYDNVQLAHARCNLSKGVKVLVKQPTLFQVVTT